MDRLSAPVIEPSAPVIELSSISVVLGGRTIVDSVSLTVTERRLGLIGANGSGKSTLARVIGGLIAPTSGAVRVVGVDPVRDGRAARGRIGFCFADPDAQIVMPTVREDIAFSLRRSDLSREARAQRVEQALARFGLTDLADAPAHRLSSGEKQLLALAATLVREPSLVICDEPTTLLDLRNAVQMAATIATLSEHLVIVSHDLDLVAQCERVIRLDDGRLTDDGRAGAVIDRYRRDMAAGTVGREADDGTQGSGACDSVLFRRSARGGACDSVLFRGSARGDEGPDDSTREDPS